LRRPLTSLAGNFLRATCACRRRLWSTPLVRERSTRRAFAATASCAGSPCPALPR